MKKVKLANNLEISPIVHGHWNLHDWITSKKDVVKLTEQAIDLGITTFDHADIYGNYSCEKLFGDNILSKNKGLRKNIQLITKCGIKLISDKFPQRKVKYYDYSYDHIIGSAEESLKNLQTNYIDLLLLHRPSPFFNLEEVSKAFSNLQKSGKVLQFGVSNFTSNQFEILDNAIQGTLVTNQIEVSPYQLDHFKNDNITYLQSKKVRPMVWSPLANGRIFSPETEREHKLLQCIKEIAQELQEEHLDKIVYKWLLMHPSGIIPVVGTSQLSRLKNAMTSFDIPMTLEQWFKIYTVSQGHKVP